MYVYMYTYKFFCIKVSIKSFCIFKTKARTVRYEEGKIGTREVVKKTTILKDR